MAERLLWPDLEPQAVAEGFIAEVPQATLTSTDILDALALRHPTDGMNGMPGTWIFLREVYAEAGHGGGSQRFDALAIGLTNAQGVGRARVVYEVKVSRGDWLRELRPQAIVYDRWGNRRMHGMTAASILANRESHPQYQVTKARKWDAALTISTEFWYAAPPHCILPDEVPDEAGLIEVRPWGKHRQLRPRVIRRAPIRDTPHPGHGFWASVLRRAAQRRP